MGSDPDDWDDDAPAVIPRKPKPSALSKIAGASQSMSVGSSLDDFITKANEKLLDSTPVPVSREKQLQAQVDELEKKLAEAQNVRISAPAVATMPTAPAKRGWGGIALAFVLGCGATFGAMSLLPKSPAPAPARGSVAQPSVTPIAPPAVTPIEPAAAPTTTAAAPTPVPSPTPTPTPATPATPERPVVAAKKPTTKHAPTHHDGDPKPITKPAEQDHGGSSDLYNPF